MGRLQGRVAVITGAGDGIGEAIARRFALEGAKVIVAEINESRGRIVTDELAAVPGVTSVMLVALVIGLAISILQALTQVQEQTLVFVPKIIAVFASMMLFLPFMGYLLAYELCDYDASICPYMMADQLSMFF